MPSSGVHIACMPYAVGKTEAVRVGLEQALEHTDAQVFGQIDCHLKQEPWQMVRLFNGLRESGADLVIADRYAQQDLRSHQRHRATLAAFWSLVVEQVTGIRVADAAAGMRAHTRQVSETFVRGLRGSGYGLEAEQLALASTHGMAVETVAVQSTRQADSTSAAKLEDNVGGLLAHAPDLLITHELRAALSHLMWRLKRRESFVLSSQFLSLIAPIEFAFVPNGEDGEQCYTLRPRNGPGRG